MTLTVVALGPDDWVSHRELRLEALRSEPTAFAMTYADSLGRDETDWRANLAAVSYWQVRDGDRAVGMAGLWEQHPGDGGEAVAHVVGMFVRPDTRRRGAGELLLRVVIDEARARGHARLHLRVETGNAGAARGYERAGFRPLGPPEPHPHADGLLEQAMVLEWPAS